MYYLFYQVWPTPTPLPAPSNVPQLDIDAGNGFVEMAEIAVQFWNKMGQATNFIMLFVVLIIVFMGFMLIFKRLRDV